MKLTSPSFSHNGRIPGKYTCDGQNISPALIISDVPSAAKSFVLIMFDPDIPEIFKKQRGIDGWNHWTVWNISPNDITKIDEGAKNIGTEGKQTGGNIGYTGPCPPPQYEPKTHRYIFTLYALNTDKINLASGSSKKEVEDAIKGHVIDKAELIGVYSRG